MIDDVGDGRGEREYCLKKSAISSESLKDSMKGGRYFFSFRFLHFSLLKSVFSPKRSCRSICFRMSSSAVTPCALSSTISS